MTIMLSRSILIDGAEHILSSEGGSAKEALEILDKEMEDVGAVPISTPPGPSRKRRTKAEMEAARASVGDPALPGVMPPAEPPKVVPPAIPPAYVFPPANPTQPFPPMTPPEMSSVTAPPLPTFAPAPPADQVPQATQSATWGDQLPPVPEGKAVEFAPPPPPVNPAPSEIEVLRGQIDDTLKRTIEVKPEWRDAIIKVYHGAMQPYGGDLFAMPIEGVKKTLEAVTKYETAIRTQLGLPPV